MAADLAARVPNDQPPRGLSRACQMFMSTFFKPTSMMQLHLPRGGRSQRHDVQTSYNVA